jgi:polysaccharide pyruvyl transferase WcaK-like protein
MSSPRLADSAHPVRIFLDHGEAYGNFGDDAMLIAAHERILRSLDGNVEFVIPLVNGARLPNLSHSVYVESARNCLPELVGLLMAHKWIRILASRLPPYSLERWIVSTGRNASHHLGLQSMLGAVVSCDVVYAVGCGNLNDVAPHVTLLYRLLLAKAVRRACVPLITSSQGVGPLTTHWARRSIQQLYTLSDHFSLRSPMPEGQSCGPLKRLSETVPIVGDEAFGLSCAKESVRHEVFRRNNLKLDDPYLVLHYRQAAYTGKFTKALPQLVEGLTHLGFKGQLIFVPMSVDTHSGCDAEVGTQLQSHLRGSVKMTVLTGVDDPSLIKSIVWNASGVIALSYHLQVFALSGSIPFIILTQGRYYGEKSASMGELVGGTTPVLDLQHTDAYRCVQVFREWFDARAIQIKDLERVGRQITAVNDYPLHQLIHHIIRHDRPQKKNKY